MDPVSALITWHRPYIFNGESINYEVLWQMNSSVAGERQRGELPAAKVHYILTNLIISSVQIELAFINMGKIDPPE